MRASAVQPAIASSVLEPSMQQRPPATLQRRPQTPQSRLAASIDTSPRLVAQAQRLAEIFAPPVQKKAPAHPLPHAPEEDELHQLKTDPIAADAPAPAAQAANRTGLPDNLKSGVESLSGMSLDHVKVHYNSAQPAQLNALAYAQGSDIHVAPGQEKHLPHEAWHIVQQAQGRVKPTMQMKGGVTVNDDAGLEREADVMGAKALAPAIQLAGGAEDEELLQGKSAPLQRAEQSGAVEHATISPSDRERGCPAAQVRAATSAAVTEVGKRPRVAGVAQAKWILRAGKRVWVPDDQVLVTPDEQLEGPTRGLAASPHTVAERNARPAPGLDGPRAFPFSGLPPLALGALVNMLPPRDLKSLRETDTTTKGALSQTGHDFMHPIYENPATAVPQVLPSVQSWARGEGPPADPSARAELIYKMAALDPLTRLDTGLGKGSTGGKKFLTGGGFLAHQDAPGETPQQAEARNLKALKNWEAAKERIEKSNKLFTNARPLDKLAKGPTATETALEYHPGGGIHSARKSKDDHETFAPVPPSRASGGSYLKVEKTHTKGANYRFARFGPFVTGKDMGYYWDPLRPPSKDKFSSPQHDIGELRKMMPSVEDSPRALARFADQQDLTALSPPQLLELGSRAEAADLKNVAVAVTQETQRRMAERLGNSKPKDGGAGLGSPSSPGLSGEKPPQEPQASARDERSNLILRGREQMAALLAEWRTARPGRDGLAPHGYHDRLAAVDSIPQAPRDMSIAAITADLDDWINNQRSANERSNQ